MLLAERSGNTRMLMKSSGATHHFPPSRRIVAGQETDAIASAIMPCVELKHFIAFDPSLRAFHDHFCARSAPSRADGADFDQSSYAIFDPVFTDPCGG